MNSIFRETDPTNKNKIWWIDYLKTGNVHAYNHDERVEFYLKNDNFADPSQRPGESIWWIDDMDRRGPLLFSFDLMTVYNYYGDYPDNLTPEQKKLFDKENPLLAY